MNFVIRSVLTIALIYASYRETGFFTALSFLLIFAALEIQGFLTKRTLNGAPPQEPGDLTPPDVHEKMWRLRQSHRR